MDDTFLMTFPAYALLFKDGSGTVVLRGGPNMWLPLFTDRDSLATYLDRSKIGEVGVLEIKTPAELVAFLENPPSRSGDLGCDTAILGCDTAIIDPITNQPRGATLLTFEGIINSLKR